LKTQTAVVDYGVGNLHSVTNAMAYLGFDAIITGDEREIERADAVILPGVGAFPDAMDNLRARALTR
jgi:glutamine amidotransferase